jgi:mannose-6-phosphate isomerase class I
MSLIYFMLISVGQVEHNAIEGDLIKKLADEFPNDVGIWCVFFLQHFTLDPGQAVFLPANEPHAYLYGGT